MLYKVVMKLWPEFFGLRLWRCSGQPCNNQQSYGQMDVMAGFNRSERSRNNLGRNSNCSGRMLYGREHGSGLSKSHSTAHGSFLSTHILQITCWAAWCLLPQFSRFMCQEAWNRGGCGGSNSLSEISRGVLTLCRITILGCITILCSIIVPYSMMY